MRDHSATIQAIRRIEIATRRIAASSLAGKYKSTFKGRGLAFSEVRPYSPGDDVRHIDWNVSARHQDQGLFVKEFTEERELTILILADISGSSGFGTKVKQKRQLIAETLALLSFAAIHNRDRVGALFFAEEVELFVPPKRGRQQVQRLIREALELEPKTKGTNVGNALSYLCRVQKKPAVCFLLSDFMAPDFSSRLAVALARHDLVAVRVTDPAELSLPDLGLVELVDPETQERVLVDSSSRKVQSAYADLRAAERKSTETTLARLGCDLVDLSTDRDHLASLVQFFDKRTKRPGIR